MFFNTNILCIAMNLIINFKTRHNKKKMKNKERNFQQTIVLLIIKKMNNLKKERC